MFGLGAEVGMHARGALGVEGVLMTTRGVMRGQGQLKAKDTSVTYTPKHLQVYLALSHVACYRFCAPFNGHRKGLLHAPVCPMLVGLLFWCMPPPPQPMHRVASTSSGGRGNTAYYVCMREHVG